MSKTITYKCCRDCEYVWSKESWEAGEGRVAFCYPAEDIKDNSDVVCSLCYCEEDK